MSGFKSIIMDALECALFLTLIALLVFAWVGFQDSDIINLKTAIGW